MNHLLSPNPTVRAWCLEELSAEIQAQKPGASDEKVLAALRRLRKIDPSLSIKCDRAISAVDHRLRKAGGGPPAWRIRFTEWWQSADDMSKGIVLVIPTLILLGGFIAVVTFLAKQL